MPGDTIKVKPFLRTETNTSLTEYGIGTYAGVGAQVNGCAGTAHLYLAGKATTDNEIGGFLEARYTSPDIFSNTSLQLNQRYFFNNNGQSTTTRIVGKYNQNFDNDINIYEYLGVNIGANKTGVTGISPMSITGINYDVNNNLSIYSELGVNKKYNPQTNKWGKTGADLTLGLKYKF